MPAGVLFVHNNFPAQFRDLAETLVARGVPCAAIGAAEAPGVQGVRIGRYALERGTTPGILPFAVRAEAKVDIVHVTVVPARKRPVPAPVYEQVARGARGFCIRGGVPLKRAPPAMD